MLCIIKMVSSVIVSSVPLKQKPTTYQKKIHFVLQALMFQYVTRSFVTTKTQLPSARAKYQFGGRKKLRRYKCSFWKQTIRELQAILLLELLLDIYTFIKQLLDFFFRNSLKEKFFHRVCSYSLAAWACCHGSMRSAICCVRHQHMPARRIFNFERSREGSKSKHENDDHPSGE